MNYEKGHDNHGPSHYARYPLMRQAKQLYQIWKGFAIVHPSDCEPSIYLDQMVMIIYYLQAGNR
jgi:hypothetical protein